MGNKLDKSFYLKHLRQILPSVCLRCFLFKIMKKGNFKHGMVGTKTYKSWENMKQRCLNKNDDEHYKDYGGRGIKVCKRWMIFENFYGDMGERPKNKTLDRIDNNGNYCKENCKWSTQKEQNNNTRRNRLIIYRRKTQTMKQWAEELGINYTTLFWRLKNGWSVERAFLNN